MKRSLLMVLLLLWVVLPSQGLTQDDDILIIVIGKSEVPYWSNVQLGVRAAAEDLGLSQDQVVFFIPRQEDVAVQLSTFENYVNQGATGIAVAASDPVALEAAIAAAVEKGVIVTTLDTPPVEDSASVAYIGTNNYEAGRTAGEAMQQILPEGGLIAIGRGSDRALNALQRTEGFMSILENSEAEYEILEPVNDRENPNTALQLANSIVASNNNLTGVFGVYTYNGSAWANAAENNGRARELKIVAFDTSPEVITYIQNGIIQATIAQREYDMGYQSVMLIYKITTVGLEQALADAGAEDGFIDTGVDVVTAANLIEYTTSLDEKGIPHNWELGDWEPPSNSFEFKPPQND